VSGQAKNTQIGPESEVIRLLLIKCYGYFRKRWVFFKRKKKTDGIGFPRSFSRLFSVFGRFPGIPVQNQPYRKKLRNGAIKTCPPD
jgi:hypothetical protein